MELYRTLRNMSLKMTCKPNDYFVLYYFIVFYRILFHLAASSDVEMIIDRLLPFMYPVPDTRVKDLGMGFYLSSNIDYINYWKVFKKRDNLDLSLIIFIIPKNIFKNYRELELIDPIPWKNAISIIIKAGHNIHKDYIIGLCCKNSVKVRSCSEPEIFKEGALQYCIKSLPLCEDIVHKSEIHVVNNV
jgi:hypothetical protein